MEKSKAVKRVRLCLGDIMLSKESSQQDEQNIMKSVVTRLSSVDYACESSRTKNA